jgi:RNA polymerase sigma factor (sigma-70 family)
MTVDKSTSRTSRERLDEQKLTELVRSVQAGSERGWDALVDEFCRMIWAVARGHRLCDADAAEVVQATWLLLLEHLHDLHEPARVGSWLATTARRECLRVLRGAKRVAPYGDDLPEPGVEQAQERAVVIAERDRALWRAFGCLRPGDQVLLRLLMAEPRPAYDEISAALDMPIGSIGPTRARALERLRLELHASDALELMVA